MLEVLAVDGNRRLPFQDFGPGRTADERTFLAKPEVPSGEPWRFRIVPGEGRPLEEELYTTRLHDLWLQDGQLFAYPPAPRVTPSRVVKIPAFSGSLPRRALYLYLPRGYDDHPHRRYPLLFMHDGQNCFTAFTQDSYAGSWQADEVADQLITQGLMRECIIVAVGNGGKRRITEYLPPYSTLRLEHPGKAGKRKPGAKKVRGRRRIPGHPRLITGRAHRTFAYYRDEVAPWVHERYRTLGQRDQLATCGSSMGGLFSAYIAWEHPEFARQHAFMSPSFWATRKADNEHLEIIERFRNQPPRDLRIWLDSGTQDSSGQGDDGMAATLEAYRALADNGYQEGRDFRYHLADGAVHHESAWAERLPLVFQFLFPPPVQETGGVS